MKTEESNEKWIKRETQFHYLIVKRLWNSMRSFKLVSLFNGSEIMEFKEILQIWYYRLFPFIHKDLTYYSMENKQSKDLKQIKISNPLLLGYLDFYGDYEVTMRNPTHKYIYLKG